ncbi:MAG: M48 family metallopeptidase [Clostridia bacterium]|nr:M48 family metallopeptidase [Clostridia bacterium]
MDRLTFDGVEVKIVKKRIKNMYLRINKDGEIVVSAPLFLSDRDIEGFVFSKREWINEARERVTFKQNRNRLYIEGEELFLLGKKTVLHIDTTRKSGYYFKGNELVICVGENSTPKKRRKELVEFYRDAMNEILPEIFEKCQRKSGLYADEWRIRDMTTRYGSCNTKEKRIWMSLWLMEKPPVCIEAVVYHELAHLKIKGHNKDFYEFLGKIYPEYKMAERLLKKQ